MKHKPEQLAFQSVLEHSFRQRRKAINGYIQANREKYIAFATYIKPDLSSPSDIYSRIAFAILSANSPFEDSVKALGYAIECYQRNVDVTARGLYRFGAFVPAKAAYVNELAAKCKAGSALYKMVSFEAWNDYRLRLRDDVAGLGLCKASFAASLLYPMSADLACVDTWLQKVFLGHSGFRDIGLSAYLKVECHVRRFARRHHVSTFLAQWMIWDHARGRGANNHAIFPGTHKGGLLQ